MILDYGELKIFCVEKNLPCFPLFCAHANKNNSAPRWGSSEERERKR